MTGSLERGSAKRRFPNCGANRSERSSRACRGGASVKTHVLFVAPQVDRRIMMFPIGLRSTILLVAAAFLFLAPASAFPCSCSLDDSSACAAAARSDSIFVGTPVSMEKVGSYRRFQFAVETAIQNVERKIVEVTTAPDSAACGYPFEIGMKYLVYASQAAGSYAVSLCSRTGPLESRHNDLELLQDRASGTLHPKLFGVVLRHRLLLNGRPTELEVIGGIADVPVRVTGANEVREARTDPNGRFRIDGMPPGKYEVTLQLRDGDAVLFDRPVVASVDDCGGEVSLAVTNTPLRGRLVPAPGDVTPERMMLVVIATESAGNVSPERNTVALTEPDGAWSVPGLPPGKYVIGIGVIGPPSASTPYPVTWYANASRPELATILDVPGNRVLSVDFQLPPRIPAITISGSTLDNDGAPLANVSVTLYDADATSYPEVSGTTSDANGRFTIVGLRGRRYRIDGRLLRPGGGISGMIEVTEDLIRSGVTLTLNAPR